MVHFYELNCRLYPDCTNVFSLFRIQLQNTTLHLLIKLLESPLVCDNFSLVPFFFLSWPWQVWGVLVKYIINIPQFGRFKCFSHDWTRVTNFWKEYHRGKFPFHHFIPWERWDYTNDLSLVISAHLLGIPIVLIRDCYLETQIWTLGVAIAAGRLLSLSVPSK